MGKREFIRALAEYLAGNQAAKSVELAMGKPSALEWQKVRRHSPLFGYPTVDEAEAQLTEFLNEGSGVCPNCSGEGEVSESPTYPEDEGYRTCKVCDGSGAMPSLAQITALRTEIETVCGELAVAQEEIARLQQELTEQHEPWQKEVARLQQELVEQHELSVDTEDKLRKRAKMLETAIRLHRRAHEKLMCDHGPACQEKQGEADAYLWRVLRTLD